MTTENQDAVLIPASSIISTLLSDDGSSTDIRSLISTSHSTITTQSTRLDSQLFNSLPTTLSSHSSLQESLSTLSNLHNLLSSFSTSLSSASSQISVLQQRSSLIDKRLKARERLERRLNDLLNNIALQPEVVKIIFDTKPLPGKDGKDEINHKWLMAIDKLDKVLQATSDLSTIQSLKKGKDKEVDALSEARNVAEACRIVASTKLLPHLLSLLSPLRTSVTSNHLILQSIILLKHSHPFYSFLARHSPRVAIDFQKGYASNARLYFETGFRRYRRSLDKLVKKGLGKWELEEKGGIGEVGNVGLNMFSKSNPQSSNPSPKPGASRPSINTSVSERPSSADSPSSSSETDSWIPDVKRLENSRLEDGPGIVLAYQADESGFRATTEALFRSLALVFVDNACSEYVFIVRFFENAILNPNSDSKELNGTASSKSKKKEAVREEEEELGGEEDDDDDEDEEAMNPVALNQREIKAGSSRPAADEMWKQVMEPVLGHWNSFTKSLLTPSPSLLSLLTMLTLNDKLIALADLRGCSSILQSPLLGFKLQAWPLVQKAFETHIDSLKRVNGGSSEVEGGALKAFSSGWGMGGMMRAALDATGAGGLGLGADELKEEHVKIICSRYARIYSSVTLLSDGQEDGMLSNSLNRLRMEIEKFVSFQSSKRSSNASAFAKSLYGVIIKGLENGPAPTVNPRIQSELSLFNELERATT